MSTRIYYRQNEQKFHTTLDLEIPHKELIKALQEQEDFEEMLEELGFLRRSDLGLEDSLLDNMKLELVKDLVHNATLDQLEQFRKNL